MDNLKVINKNIEISGLKKAYRILHVTDVHITMWDERDETSVITYGAHKGKKLVSEFGVKREKGFTVDGVSTADKFAELCDFLKDNPSFSDAVVFTGDILDFYTDAAFDFMVDNLNKIPMPYMFVLGNHDYIFSNHEKDDTYERFAKLGGGSYKIQKLKFGELTLVGSYNGRYAYDDETLELIADDNVCFSVLFCKIFKRRRVYRNVLKHKNVFFILYCIGNKLQGFVVVCISSIV